MTNHNIFLNNFNKYPSGCFCFSVYNRILSTLKYYKLEISFGSTLKQEN